MLTSIAFFITLACLKRLAYKKIQNSTLGEGGHVPHIERYTQLKN